MSDHHGHRRLLFVVVAGLFVLTAVLVFVKVRFLDFSLSDRSSVFYQLDAMVSFLAAAGQPVRVSLALPELTPGYYFIPVPEGSHRFRMIEEEGDRRVVLELPPATGRQTSSSAWPTPCGPRAPCCSRPPSPNTRRL